MLGFILGVVPLPFFLITGVFTVLAAIRFRRAWQRRWEVEDTPTSTCRGAFVGLNEMEGRAVPIQVLTAPLSNTPCVWFEWDLERYRKSKDSGQWVTIEKRRTCAPFWLEDETGRILVRPRGSDVEGVAADSHDVGRSFPVPYSRWQLRQWTLAGEDVVERSQSLRDPAYREAPDPGSLVRDSTAAPIVSLGGRLRITERRIPAGAPLYLLGNVAVRADVPSGLVLVTTPERKLIVSGRPAAEVSARAGRSVITSLLMLLVSSSAFALFAGLAIDGWWLRLPLLVVGLELVALLAIALVRIQHRLVAVKQQAAKAWSLIDVALRRRYDLLPQLAGVAEAYADHERSLLEAAARLRTSATPLPAAEDLPSAAALHAAAEADLRSMSAAEPVFAVAEALPAMQADQVFVDLQRRIVDSEEAVVSARRFYNDAITVLRDRRQTFPGRLIAPLVQVPSWQLFEADRVERDPVPAAVEPEPADPVPAEVTTPMAEPSRPLPPPPASPPSAPLPPPPSAPPPPPPPTGTSF